MDKKFIFEGVLSGKLNTRMGGPDRVPVSPSGLPNDHFFFFSFYFQNE